MTEASQDGLGRRLDSWPLGLSQQDREARLSIGEPWKIFSR